MRSFLRELLDVVSRGWVVGDAESAGEPIEAVADSDIECLAKDSIALLCICNDLSVASADVENDGIHGPRNFPTHFDVYVCSQLPEGVQIDDDLPLTSDAVIDGHYRLLPQQSHCASGERTRREWGAHPGAFRVADAIDIFRSDLCLSEGLLSNGWEPLPMVIGYDFGQEAFARGSVVCVSDIRQNLCPLPIVVVLDDADAYFVGRAFYSNGDEPHDEEHHGQKVATERYEKRTNSVV